MFFSKIVDYFYLFSQRLLEVISDVFGIFYIRFSFIIIVGINSFSWLIAYITKVSASENLAILHYNVDFGVNLVGRINQIYNIPFLGLMIILITFFLVTILNRSDRRFKEDSLFPSYVLLIAAFLSNFFLLLATAFIYLINFR